MKKYWLHNPLFDSVFLIAPPFLVLLSVFVFQEKITYWEAQFPFWTWLIFIVFIDVAHVYATLFKTYFNPLERQKFKKELRYIPFVCFGIGVFLYGLGYQIFWSVLAYIAVFHFIRQQYGFLKLYLKNESHTQIRLETLAIYNATIYPMCYWFFAPKKNFNWFVENEFLTFENDGMLQFLKVIYLSVIVIYSVYLLRNYIIHNIFNLPKVLLVLGTYLSWYMGIVYYNNDLIFTALNVVSHGIPYIGLVFINQKNQRHLNWIPKINHWKGITFYLGLLLVLAFTEELAWELGVWQEHFNIDSLGFLSQYQILLVPLLMVPQFTHYVLDGIIWKKPVN